MRPITRAGVRAGLPCVAAAALALGLAPAAALRAAAGPVPSTVPFAPTTGAALPDGSLLVASTVGVTKLDPSGHVDQSYGSGGSFLLGDITWLGANAAGTTYIVSHGAVSHLLPDGQLDRAYGANGSTPTPGIAFAAIDPQGRVLAEVGSAVTRLTAAGTQDTGFVGAAPLAPGPIAVWPDGSLAVVGRAGPGIAVTRISATGNVLSEETARGLPDGSAPQAAAPFGGGEIHVVGADSEEMIMPGGGLDPAFGQGTCGDTVGTPTMPGGSLSLLADGRTADVSSTNHGTYDIVPHVFVRSEGRRDLSFGVSGEASLNQIETATFLASSDSALWLALSDGTTSQVVKVPLSPAVPTVVRGAPEDFAQWAVTTAGDVLQLPPYYGTSPVPCGSLAGKPLAQPVVGAAPSPDGVGYWLAAGDGGVFSFGDARFFGSTGAMRLNRPIVAMSATPDGRGYWLVASDGGVFSFGDARFFGSTGAMRLNKPIVAMSATPDGRGYWLVASDGGVFTFGDAGFHGSAGGIRLAAPVVGMLPTPSGSGYLLAARDGGVFTFGDAGFGGNIVVPTPSPVVAITASPPGTYAVALADGSELNVSYGAAHLPAGPAHPVVAMFPG